ncbi:MAG: FHA domain-containing protein [Planctomycetota bacterium]|nr:FHA domain-containing protein [Planctomycetota bacterium]
MNEDRPKKRRSSPFPEKTARFNRKRFTAKLQASEDATEDAAPSGGSTLASMVAAHATESKDDFVKQYAHPFLMLLCGGAEKLVDSGFFTTSGGGSSQATTDESLLTSIVFPLVKKKKGYENLYSLGRTEKNDIMLPYSGVSKFHAYIQCRNGAWSISDCDSTNGTFVDKVSLEPQSPRVIISGSRISLSKACTLVFACPDEMHTYLQAFNQLHSRD